MAKKASTNLPRSLADLKPAAYNPRDISPQAAHGLKVSLRKFGDLSGLVWNKRTGNLVAGHQRIDQLKSLGATLSEVNKRPVVKVGDHTFPVRVVDWSVKDEKTANLAANNKAICGEFTDAVDAIAREVQVHLGDLDFEELQLGDLLGDDTIDAGTELAEPGEYQEQCAVASYLDGLGVLWCHVPNEDLRGREEDVDLEARRRAGALAKAAGVKPGVLDNLIFTPPPARPDIRGVAVELKRRIHGKATPGQLEWMAGLRRCGWLAEVKHGAREAVEWLRGLGYG